MRTISQMCLAIKVWSMFDVNKGMRLMGSERTCEGLMWTKSWLCMTTGQYKLSVYLAETESSSSSGEEG